MTILTIRTDKPEAEVGLFEGDEELAYEKWQAHRQLSLTIHNKIRDLLKSQGKTGTMSRLWFSTSGLAVLLDCVSVRR